MFSVHGIRASMRNRGFLRRDGSLGDVHSEHPIFRLRRSQSVRRTP